MDIEENVGPPRGLLLGIGILGIVLGGALAGEFIFRLQPALGTGAAAAAGTVLMPVGVGSNQALNFSPDNITVIIGQNNTVTFINKDQAPHTVTADDGSFNSGNLNPGDSWTYTFTTPGTFAYHCNYHSWMRGIVVVLASTTST
jgi:plastocyanin